MRYPKSGMKLNFGFYENLGRTAVIILLSLLVTVSSFEVTRNFVVSVIGKVHSCVRVPKKGIL